MKTMKNYLLLLLSAFIMAACTPGNEDSKVLRLTGGTSTSQSVYADKLDHLITFTAIQPWSIQVNDMTPKSGGSGTDWLTLNRYSGEPGDVSINATLLLNATGNSRTAKIKIECGGVIVTITIEQQAVTQNGDKPVAKYMVDKIVVLKNNSVQEIWQFTYNGSTITKLEIDRSGSKSGYTESYTFQKQGNNQLLVYRHRLSTSVLSQVTYQFDLNDKGYAVSGEELTESITSEYKYDVENRLTSFGFSVLEYRYEWTNSNLSTVSEYLLGEKDGSYMLPMYSTLNDKVNIDLNMLYIDLKSTTSNVSNIRFLDPNILSMVGYLGVRSKNFVKVGIKSQFNSDLNYEFNQNGVPVNITNRGVADTYAVSITYKEK